MHVVRPDRVHRTGVLQSIVGYQPGVDARAVLNAFSMGPPSGQTLAGFGDGLNWFQRLTIRVKSAIAERKASKFMFQGDDNIAPQTPGPGPAMISQIAAARYAMSMGRPYSWYYGR